MRFLSKNKLSKNFLIADKWDFDKVFELCFVDRCDNKFFIFNEVGTYYDFSSPQKVIDWMKRQILISYFSRIDNTYILSLTSLIIRLNQSNSVEDFKSKIVLLVEKFKALNRPESLLDLSLSKVYEKKHKFEVVLLRNLNMNVEEFLLFDIESNERLFMFLQSFTNNITIFHKKKNVIGPNFFDKAIIANYRNFEVPHIKDGFVVLVKGGEENISESYSDLNKKKKLLPF